MEQVDMPDIGLLAHGRLGVPLAHALLAHGIPLRVYTSRPESLHALASQGATLVEHHEQLARPGGIVISCWPDEQAALRHVVEDQGFLAHLGPGGLHLCLAPLSPHVATELERLSARRSCAFLAGMLLAGPSTGHVSSWSLLLSGQAAARARLVPLLSQAISVVDLGESCAAAPLMGLAALMLAGTTIEALGEALALLDACGVQGTPFFSLLRETGWHARLGHEISERLHQRDVARQGGSLSVDEGVHLARLTRKVAISVGLALPSMESVLAHAQAAQFAGYGGQDWTILSLFAGDSVKRLTRRRL